MIVSIRRLIQKAARSARQISAPARDQSYDLLMETERLSLSDPNWDRPALLASAQHSYRDGASAQETRAIYGVELAQSVTAERH